MKTPHVIACFLLGTSLIAFAQTVPPAAVSPPADPVETPSNLTADLPKDLGGFGLAPGISLTVNLGRDSRVDEAVLDPNGVVRVSKDKNAIPRILLEAHYFFTPEKATLPVLRLTNPEVGAQNVKRHHNLPSQWGHGPFICVLPGSNFIDAAGAGWMIGLKRQGTSNTSTIRSFNLGLGYIVDSSVKTLGDGIHPNQPLPKGETTIRYKDTQEGGIVIVFSVGF